MKWIIITLIFKQKNNHMKRYSYNGNTFNSLYNDHFIGYKKKEKMKNNFIMNESELIPYAPRFTYSEYFAYPNKVFPSVNNFGKKYFFSNSGYPLDKNVTYFNRRRNTTENDKNYEINNENSSLYNLKRQKRRLPYNNYSNRKAISSRINKDINEQISQYIDNFDSLKKKNFFNSINPNTSSNNQNIKTHKSFNQSNNSNTKKEKVNNKMSNKLLYNNNKNINHSSFNGLDIIKTNYSSHQKNSNNNINSGNNVLSNVNSISSRINETNNNSHFLNGIKMISGVNEYFCDFNSGNRNKNNNNEQKTELSLQTLSDSKLLELASRYANEDDNSSENYQMNNILHNKKKLKSKNNE